MNALESNRYTAVWRDFAAAAPRPRAIVVVSAHWYVPEAAVTAMAKPRTIHDFAGFPRALSEVDYPAPGDPQLAAELAHLLEEPVLRLDQEWGLDHGTWSLLVHMIPAADVPVVQLSLPRGQSPEWHLERGRKLAALRDRGVLVLASGNVVHNLRAIDWRRTDQGFEWAERFDQAARDVLTRRPADAVELVRHADYPLASPTPEHFLPLLYLAGMADAAGEPLRVLCEGYAFGSLSMTSFALGAPMIS